MNSINNLVSPYQSISNQDYTNAIVHLFQSMCAWYNVGIENFDLHTMEKMLKRDSQTFYNDVEVTIDYLS